MVTPLNASSHSFHFSLYYSVSSLFSSLQQLTHTTTTRRRRMKNNVLENNNNINVEPLPGGGGGKSPAGMAAAPAAKQPPRVGVVRAVTSAKAFKKVQVVYYLTRHGHLDHPHYMELTLLANHQLRLRDVMDRLSALRGKAMPSMYSWSCKRSYKNGYVWNDLSENDVIRPTDGAEYVLKGSEIIDTCPEFPRPIDHHHVVNSRQLIQDLPGRNHHSKRSLTATNPPIAHSNNEVINSFRYEEKQDNVGEEEEYDVEDKTCYTTTTTTTTRSRCSRGVTTDDLYTSEPKPDSEPNTKPTSDPEPGDTSARYLLEDNVVSVGPSPVPRRNSVLMQLISCGNMAKSVVEDRDPVQETRTVVTVVEYLSDELADDKAMVRYMSENPRFGNPQSEDKMYFSGSIVDRAETEPVPEVLKRSNSYNELSVSQVKEEVVAVGDILEKEKDKAAAKSKCIPCIMSSSSKTAKRK